MAKRSGLVTLTLLLLWVSLAVALDTYGKNRVPLRAREAIVVTGCRVRPSGQPSLALQRRTRHAVELWRAGVAPRVVFTGGVGDYPPSEAAAAADYARSLGLPDSAIDLEEKSTSTLENASFSAVKFRYTRIVVVTDSYHVFRSKRVFGRFFDDVDAVGSTPGLWVRARGSLREVLAVGTYGLKGRL